MGVCSSKSGAAPEAQETEFRLRKTADGRRLGDDSTKNLSAFAEDSGMSVGSEREVTRGEPIASLRPQTRNQEISKKDFKTKKKNAIAVEDDQVLEGDDDDVYRFDQSLLNSARAAMNEDEDADQNRSLLRRQSIVKAPNQTVAKPPVELSERLKRYEAEPKLKANELPVSYGPEWLAPPDIQRETTVRKPKKYSIGNLARGDHKLEPTNLTDKDFSDYAPGNGPWFNGPFPSMMASSAKQMGLAYGKFCVVGVITLFWVPNFLLYHRLLMNGTFQAYSRLLSAILSSLFMTRTVLNMNMELCRMFWRGSIVNSQVICSLIGAVGFFWQTLVIFTVGWLSDNRGIFSFLIAFGVGWFIVWRQDQRHEKQQRIRTVMGAFLALEKDAKHMAQLMGSPVVRTNDIQYMNAAPVWARYRPDELVPWLNNFLTQVWPFYNKAASELVREIVEPLMEQSRPSMLKRLTFKQLDFGENPFMVRSVSYVGKKAEDKGMSLDIDFAWAGRSNIVLAAKTHIGADINIAVKDLEIYTKLRVTLNPLVPLPSPLGGVVISMTERPIVEFHVELPSGLDVLYAAIDKWLEEFVAGLLGDMFIQPERLVIPLSFNFDPIVMPDGEVKPFKWYDHNVLQLRNTGVLKVTVVRAENVPSADLLSKTDPFVKMFVKKHGLQVNTTTIMNNEDPVWNEIFYIPVDDVDLRVLKVAMYDHDVDPLSSDDKLGATEVRIDTIKAATADGSEQELWLDFPEQVKGNVKKPPMKLLLNAQFISFGSDIAQNMFTGLGLLSVHVIRGRNLQPMDSNGLSDPYVKVKVPKFTLDSMDMDKGKILRGKRGKKGKKNAEAHDYTVYSSKIHYKNLNPEFNAMFEFSPASEDTKVSIELFDVDSTFPMGTKSKFMGNLEVPISTIIHHGGSMEARFKVGNAKSGELDIAFNWQPYT
ncbi:C2 calcium-dependent membrane targeting [Ostreococcus tauri]|uniref:C2 calcium-dependent membrane targeting n=1 Tax=Ostreococcus tauri TaxID=70448 RepID=A0A096P815_OSTTA|nr:C2 calcium-dependent membrane targeting [Ostreococcus tauri]CEG00342.1 C2 calcium-dependent membrane targeting [Ostreococcus tauri]|eukprot:XP_003078411.2 C2 calcium-dependent membrane targeting [Ostreococcus tauri]